MKMLKTPQFILVAYGALFALCIIWLGVSLLYLKDIFSPLFFLCIFGAIVALRLHEKNEFADYIKGLFNKIKRLESKAWYYESIITNSKDIIFTTDVEHRIIKFNKGSENTFGIKSWEILGKNVSSLFEEPEQIEKLIQEIKLSGKPKAIELLVRNRETQEEHWLSVGVSRLVEEKLEAEDFSDQKSLFLGEIFTCKNVTHKRMLEQELKEKNEQLMRLSLTDSLTNLYNVRHLKNELQRMNTVLGRYTERKLALALIDVDKFKEYNDNLGHLAGDNLLIILSDIINAQIRKNLDTAYRYGGDEFVLLLPDTDTDGAKVICSRILQQFLEYGLGETSLSIGIAEYNRAWGNLTASLLVSKADEAMYMVKVRGGNGIHLFEKPLSPELAARETVDSSKIPR